jgi:hypothetical protein
MPDITVKFHLRVRERLLLTLDAEPATLPFKLT